MTAHNNPEPWARTTPANPANILREIGAQISKEKRKELQATMREDKDLEREFDRLCSDRALKENREQEYKLHSDLSITAETAAEKIRELRQFSENAPVIKDRIEGQRAALLKKLFPTAAELSAHLLKAINAQLDSLPKLEVAVRWGIALSDDFYTVVTYPLLRLRSMVEFDLPIFQRGATNQTNYSAHYLLEAAGVIGQEDKI